ncbi:MAG: RagB/SusD family nutrient uptake outer membrane protein [Cytophagia bacterium]|nr:RagB/SusD family nutrient uptake outer membrane protein [Cytophagia bacterium]
MIMIFNNYKKILLVAATLLVTACEDKLDLTDPNNAEDKFALATDTNVKSTLIGAYNNLSAGAFFGGNTLRNSELMAANDEIVFSGTFNDVSDLYRKEMIAANSDVANMWIAAYATINTVNNVLSALNVVNEEDRDQVEGEALFLRGLSYFELIQFFAQPYSAGGAATNLGVPIRLVEDRNSTRPVGRATVQQVYDLIIDDLTTAESQLAEGPVSGKATAEAAAAVLSRVYLQMANYTEARDAADRAISSGNYELVDRIDLCFEGPTTSEDIFNIPVSEVDGVNNMVTFFAASAFGGRGDIEVQDSHLNLYESGDERLDLFYIDPSTDDIRTGKWTNQFGNVKIIRLAEMYLTRAECNVRLGTSVGDSPLNDVNLIRERAGLTPLGAVTLADILNERRLELAHEGQRLHDAKRLLESIALGATFFSYDDDLLVFPIPQREIDVNTALAGQQNPGYITN